MEYEPNIVIEKDGYSIVILSGNSDPLDELDDNVDVQVDCNDGSYYTATLFSIQNIHSLFAKNKVSGDCAGGLYFSCPDMVIVEKLTEKVVEKLVDHLVDEKELGTVFTKYSKSESTETYG